MQGYSLRESDHKRDTKREPRYGKISDTGNLKMKNMQKMMKMFAGDRMAWKIQLWKMETIDIIQKRM